MTELQVSNIYQITFKKTDDEYVLDNRSRNIMSEGIYIVIKKTDNYFTLSSKDHVINLNENMINKLQLEIKTAIISKEYREKLNELFKEHLLLDNIYQKQLELNLEIHKVLNSIKNIKENIKLNLDKTITETAISNNLCEPSNSLLFFEINHLSKTVMIISLEKIISKYIKETDYNFVHKDYDNTLYLDKQKAIDTVGIKYDKILTENFIKDALQDIEVTLVSLEPTVTLSTQNVLYTELILKLEIIDESNLDFNVFYEKLNTIIQKLDLLF